MLSWKRIHKGNSINMAGGERDSTRKQLSRESDTNKEQAIPYLQWDVMSLEQLEAALGKSEEELQLLLSDKLHLTNSQVCMREAALLHYYHQGLCWARDTHLSPRQTSFSMALLDVLLHNITVKGMDFVDNVLDFAKALAVACRSPPSDEGPSPLLSSEEAQGLIGFISSCLFQKYQLYTALQSSGPEEWLLGAQETVDVLWSQEALVSLEEGIATHLV